MEIVLVEHANDNARAANKQDFQLYSASLLLGQIKKNQLVSIPSAKCSCSGERFLFLFQFIFLNLIFTFWPSKET